MTWFFITFFLLWAIVHFYFLRRTAQALEALPTVWRRTIIGFMLFSASGYVLSRSLFSGMSNPLYDVVLFIGSIWFSILHHGCMALLLVETGRLLFRKRIAELRSEREAYNKIKLKVFAGAAVLVLLVTAAGYVNARSIEVTNLIIPLKNAAHAGKEIKAVFFSDSHLTPITGTAYANTIVATINALQPDIVLAAGDVVDDKVVHLRRYKFHETLRQLRSKYGVYMCNGNHEYIVGVEEADSFLKESGVVVLRDSFAVIADAMVLIGREDSAISRFTEGKFRKSLKELADAAPAHLPKVALDHQPFSLRQVAEAGVAAQLSGHTHHGQLWPFNFVTAMVYEVSRGYKNVNGAHIYVSSGVGAWGPPVRTGSSAELVQITFRFTE